MTANRSLVGILNEFLRRAKFWLAADGYEKGDDDDLLAISREARRDALQRVEQRACLSGQGAS
ncbi:MAG: hypothetical protein WA085_09115 [Sphingobium sp.]|uniref:hypothetical protein n=1 Tax=Sphingobium sp. CECT 9361 TaxID=2845384 RepID=UPI001E64507B|nr:hypothetical protein [Sphingobium sp. CECT 9361]CAH0348252.1 hypothetical protein SPH9361_00006 [Sphingobium sp. CECT 9361]